MSAPRSTPSPPLHADGAAARTAEPYTGHENGAHGVLASAVGRDRQPDKVAAVGVAAVGHCQRGVGAAGGALRGGGAGHARWRRQRQLCWGAADVPQTHRVVGRRGDEVVGRHEARVGHRLLMALHTWRGGDGGGRLHVVAALLLLVVVVMVVVVVVVVVVVLLVFVLIFVFVVGVGVGGGGGAGFGGAGGGGVGDGVVAVFLLVVIAMVVEGRSGGMCSRERCVRRRDMFRGLHNNRELQQGHIIPLHREGKWSTPPRPRGGGEILHVTSFRNVREKAICVAS
eukprot:365419-Chlamydomonas_euryale.AAC.7